MSLTVHIQSRAFSDELQTLPVRYKVQRYSWSVFGGPKQAEISVTAEDENDLWEMIERLRCPLIIYSEKGDPVWWGYIAEVELIIEGWSLGVNIDSMYNRVAVAYTDEEGRKTTDWLEDAVSATEYGKKELLLTNSGSAQAHAEAARARALAEKKFPRPIHAEGGDAGVVLRCRGWYDTLGWLYYQNVGIDPVDTATQAAAIATTAGQFLSAVDQGVSSGLEISEFRDGDGLALYEIEELLKMGTSNFRRMLASVDINRRLRIYEEPDESKPYYITKKRELSDELDTPIRKEICPVGVYARLKDVIPGSLDTTKMADPTLVFIESAEYTPETDDLMFEWRGLDSPWDIGVPRDG